MNFNISAYIIGITSKIAHAISQNLTWDAGFNVDEYLFDCMTVMYEAKLPPALIDTILDNALQQGIQELAMGITLGNSGAQLHPSVVLREDCATLVGFLD